VWRRGAGVDGSRWASRSSKPLRGGQRRPGWVRLPPTPASRFESSSYQSVASPVGPPFGCRLANGFLSLSREEQSEDATAGVNGKRLSPHTLRHAAATDFLRNGGDAFALQKLLGHSSLTVTRMYVDLVATDLQDAHKRASPRDNLRVRQRA